MQSRIKLIVSAVALVLVAPVYAQEDGVVVTATRFPEKRLESPVGVTVITREQIANSTAASLPDLLSRYAGINTRNNAGSPDVQIDMRGFGMSGDQNTLVLLDGQRMNENELVTVRWSSIPLEAIERVEIQRGGGAVLYGGGATGGTINIITRSPIAGSKTAEAGTSYGTYNTGGVRASFNLAGTNAGFALTASQNTSDNYRANNRLEQNNLLGDLRWTGNRGGVVLKFGLDDQSLRLPGVRTNVQLETDRRGATTPMDYSSRDSKNAALSGRYEFDAFDVAADLSFRDTRRDSYFANIGFFIPPAFIDTRGKVWAFSPRAKVPFELFGRANTLIVGIDADHWDYLSVRSTDISTQNAPVANIAATQRDRAVYAQNHTALTDATKFTLGMRTQHVDVTSNDRATALPLIASASQSRTPRSWEAALRHNFNASAAVYGKIGASFRVATLDEMFNNCGFFDLNTFTCFSTITPLEPQTSRDTELGVEYRRTDWRVRASMYRMDIRNEIHFNALTFVNMNLSPTQRRGFETEGSWKLASRWDLFGSYTHARAIFREGVYGGVDVTGKNIPLVPRDQVKLGVSWAVTDNTRVSGALAHVGKQYYDNDQANNFLGGQMPSYLTADLKLSHVTGPWRFTLAGNNLTDKKYYTYAIRGGAATATNFNAYPMAERNFLFTTEYRFR